MTQRTKKILAVNPGSRYLGLAFFNGPQLCDWRIRVLRGQWSAGKRRRIVALVADAIELYEPTVVVIKRLHPSRRSDHLAETAKDIKKMAQGAGRVVHEYGIDGLKIRLAGDLGVNKVQLAELLSQQYPILLSELDTERRSKNPYHIRVFEAVALGACYAHDQPLEYH